jgi:lipid-binding SYLF domain-containing protein
MKTTKLLMSAAAVGGLLAGGATVPALAQNGNNSTALNDAQTQIADSVKAVDKMDANPGLKKLMAKAHGIFIVPNFGRGAFIVGGRGGEGVLMIHDADGKWSSPSFYNIGAISIGAQAGGSAGSVAFLLMSNQAVKHFMSNNNFSLNAGAGLSIVNYSANTQASWGKDDIIVWSNTSGAYAGATVSGTDINWDGAETRAFYGKPNLKQDKVFETKMDTSSDNALQEALPNNT